MEEHSPEKNRVDNTDLGKNIIDHIDLGLLTTTDSHINQCLENSVPMKDCCPAR